MYIVNRGRLQVMGDNGKSVLATLNAGSYFGEISILNMGTAGKQLGKYRARDATPMSTDFKIYTVYYTIVTLPYCFHRSAANFCPLIYFFYYFLIETRLLLYWIYFYTRFLCLFMYFEMCLSRAVVFFMPLYTCMIRIFHTSHDTDRLQNPWFFLINRIWKECFCMKLGFFNII